MEKLVRLLAIFSMFVFYLPFLQTCENYGKKMEAPSVEEPILSDTLQQAIPDTLNISIDEKERVVDSVVLKGEEGSINQTAEPIISTETHQDQDGFFIKALKYISQYYDSESYKGIVYNGYFMAISGFSIENLDWEFIDFRMMSIVLLIMFINIVLSFRKRWKWMYRLYLIQLLLLIGAVLLFFITEYINEFNDILFGFWIYLGVNWLLIYLTRKLYRTSLV